jgi:hypothetical protein
MPFVVPDWVSIGLDYNGYVSRNAFIAELQRRAHANAMAAAFPRLNLVCQPALSCRSFLLRELISAGCAVLGFGC